MSDRPMSLPHALHDTDRLAALDSYDILDTPPEEDFGDIVHLAALACDAPVALVSLVAGNRQWFKARVGFQSCQTDLDSSVCVHALAEPDLLVLPDLTADPRTASNPLVTGAPHLRFYAGAPLRDRDGHVLGSLCIIDRLPRPGGLTARQAEVLRTLARQVMALLELRRTVNGQDSFIARRRGVEERLGEDAARLRLSEAHWRGLFERLSEGFVIVEAVRDVEGTVIDWRHLDANQAWGEMVGIDPLQAVGRTVRDVMPSVEEAWISDLAGVADTGEATTFTHQVGTLQRWYEGRAFSLENERFAILFVEVTGRVLADIRRSALLEVGDHLREQGTVEDMTRTACAVVGRALGVTRVGFGRVEGDVEQVVIGPDWTAEGMPSVAGRHRFDDYGNIRQELLLGEPLIIRDVLTDPRTAADPLPMVDARIRALVNIPIRERGRTVAVFLVHDTEPRAWEPETVAFLHNVADRLTAAVARLRAEESQQLLNQELSHRMKNMLAMVQAIATQTLKGVAEQDAVTAFRQRLHALASAHDVLLQQSWASAPLRKVVQTVLGASSQVERFTLSGPDVTLGPRATLSMSLLLHELATNAVKHGALSVEAGRVVVAWQVDTAADELVFSWQETGGLPAAEPTRKGFGSRLIRSGLIGTGGVVLRYLPTGFEAEMRASLEQVQAT